MSKTMHSIIEDKIMADEFEMEEIRDNRDLRERIRAGSRDAANREGRFVDLLNRRSYLTPFHHSFPRTRGRHRNVIYFF